MSPVVETGRPAPEHWFTNFDDARHAISVAIEYLIDVDGYTVEDVNSYLDDVLDGYN